MKFKKRKISNRLIAVSSIFFITSVILVSAGSFFFTSGELRREYVQYNSKVLNVICGNFEDYIGQISRLSLNLRNDESLIDSLDSGDYSYEIEDKLKLAYQSHMASLGITRIEFYIPKTGRELVLEDNTVKFAQNEHASEDWYRRTVSSEDFQYIEPARKYAVPSQTGGGDFMILRRSIIDIQSKKPMVVMSIHVGMGIMNKFISLARINEGETLFIFDGDGTAFYANSLSDGAPVADGSITAILGGGSAGGDAIFSFNRESYIKALSGLPGDRWKMVKVVPLRIINSEINKIFSFGLVVLIGFMLITTAAIIIIVKRMTSGITRLAKYMDIVAAGKFDVHISGTGDDEIGLLTRRFNSMAKKVDELVNEEYRLKLSEKNAALKALEAQINPHFLYNTLQAISGKALMNRQEEISRMLGTLASTFRYCASMQRMIPVYDELENIGRYIQLCKLRFGGRLGVEYEVDDRALDFMIPKMLLQVLVENSIKYAVEATSIKVTVRICISVREGAVHISVSDDGPGVSAESLGKILEGLNEERWNDNGKKGTGIANLYSRIKLIFGSDVEFRIVSVQGKGFGVSITLPVKEVV